MDIIKILPRAVRIPVEGGALLTAYEGGKGRPTVILVHGFGEASYVWARIAPTLVRKHRTLALDLRGHGGSDWSVEGTYNPDVLVEDLTELIQQQCEDRYVVIGHSLGASTAMRYAAVADDRCAGIVAIEPSLLAPSAASSSVRQHLLNNRAGFASHDEFLRCLCKERPTLSADWQNYLAQQALKRAADGRLYFRFDPALLNDVAANQTTHTRVPWRDFDAIKLPLLLLRGQASSILSAGDATRIHAAIPTCRAVTVKRAGHSVIMENPADVIEEIDLFLRRAIAL